MAKRDEYVLSEVVKTQVNGGQVIAIAGTFETAVADDAGSIYRIGKVGADWVPLRIDINADSITGADDTDVGLYATLENGGAVKDANILADDLDLSSGAAIGSEKNGLEDLAIADIGKQMYELAGDSDASEQMYDLALTVNGDVSVALTISVRCLFAKAA